VCGFSPDRCLLRRLYASSGISDLILFESTKCDRFSSRNPAGKEVVNTRVRVLNSYQALTSQELDAKDFAVRGLQSARPDLSSFYFGNKSHYISRHLLRERNVLVKLTFFGDVNEIGGNKILLEDRKTARAQIMGFSTPTSMIFQFLSAPKYERYILVSRIKKLRIFRQLETAR
jgi:hypothetical protein